MSSDLFSFDGSIFSDPFSVFSDSEPIDNILQEIPDYYRNENVLDEIDKIASTLLSSSPPSHQMGNLSLSQSSNFGNASNSANGYADFSVLEVKTEQSHIPFYSASDYYNYNSFPHSYDGHENAVKMMQRSYSSDGFDGKPSLFSFQPRFDSLMESPNLQSHVLSSPENSSSSGQMRRVFSAGDLQSIKTSQTRQRLSSSPLATESSSMEEANSKVGRYSAEERKERIHRYRAKRTQRNFSKTIKYACRKTLADNRPRIRGRFARNDEAGEIPKTATFDRYDDQEDDLWLEGFHEEEDERGLGRSGALLNNYGSTQFRCYSYQ